MQFSSPLALLACAAGAMALASGPVVTSPVFTLTVTGLSWNTTADNLQVSFNIKSSAGSSGTYHCDNNTVQWDETLICGSDPDIKFGFIPDGSHKFQWFNVYWQFPAGALADDGSVYLANGINSIADSACSATTDGQQCAVDKLSMQGRTNIVTN